MDGKGKGGDLSHTRYRMLRVGDVGRLVQGSRSLVRRMARSGALPPPVLLGSGEAQPGQVQRWRPEEVADSLGLTLEHVLAWPGEPEAGR